MATVLLLACSPARDPQVPPASDGTGTSTSGSTWSTDPAASSTDDSTTDPTTGSSSEETAAAPEDEGSGFVATPDIGSPRLLPNGAMCTFPDECESEQCWDPFDRGSGICSACDEDADCMRDGEAGTCGFGSDAWADCTDGSRGSVCESSEGCQPGLFCVVVFDTFGQCSSCTTDEDCEENEGCAFDDEVGGLTCFALGTKPDGGLCELEGAPVCMSGVCSPLEVDGTVTDIGACGECLDDDSCPDGESCVPATFLESAIAPSTCV